MEVVTLEPLGLGSGERNMFRLAEHRSHRDRASERERVNRPACTIEVVTNYDLSHPHAKMPHVGRVKHVAFFDITFWGAHPPSGAVRRALASNIRCGVRRHVVAFKARTCPHSPKAFFRGYAFPPSDKPAN